jgi:endonuclease G
MLNPTPGKTVVGEYLTIIQHPGGERKQVCVRENKLIKYDDSGNTIWYNTDTVGGSSGSPVFNNSWEVVALHHSGVPKTDARGRWLTVDGRIWDASMDESQIGWLANEGIRISRILELLRAGYASHPLAAPLLAPGAARPPEMRAADTLQRQSETVDGELRVTVPVQIAIKVGTVPALSTPPEPQPFASSAASKAPPAGHDVGVEKVDVDQSNYSKRTGYKRDFLGSSSPVPLPRVTGSALKSNVLTFTTAGKKQSELKYWDYSVVMHKTRKLAIYSAVNVDANQRPADSNREGDRWYFDTRLQESDQIGPEFYGEQTAFEADRSKNPFDRGHLTRRMDAQWGKDDQMAKRNGDDSFHFTNCSPQHWRFNQGQKRWLGLEDYVIDTFAGETGKACVINGPVFDAPLSRKGADGRIVPNLAGASRKDPTFGGVAIPKMFFKVVACRSNGTLSAAAFLMSQEDFLVTVDRLKGMPAIEEERLTTPEARLYQVSIADLENLTGLDFGPLTSAESGLPEAIGVRGARTISEFRDIRLGP